MSLSRTIRRKAPLGRMGTAPKYDGPPPTIDSCLWLKKVGMALQAMGLCTNTRVDIVGWERTGKLAIELEYAQTAGKRHYTRHEVPVGACINHDTRHVLGLLMKGSGHGDVVLTETKLDQVTGVILRELDLAHVHGG